MTQEDTSDKDREDTKWYPTDEFTMVSSWIQHEPGDDLVDPTVIVTNGQGDRLKLVFNEPIQAAQFGSHLLRVALQLMIEGP